MGSFAVAYAACVPLSTYLSKPGGFVQSALDTVLTYTIPGVVKNRQIPAIAAFYIYAVYPVSGAFSVAGQAAARKAFDNNHPRKHDVELRGFPLRLRSAHLNLMETFPPFALAAGLAQILAPNNQQITNLLGLYALVRVFIYYPAYLLDISPPRSVSHLLSIATLFNVCWMLAKGA